MKSKLSSNIALIILLLFCIVMTCNGQKITVSPASVPIWGQTTGYSHVGVEYKDIGAHYFHSQDIDFEFPMTYKKSPDKNIGISYTPVKAGILNIGLIAFPRQFPEKGSTHVNLWIELDIPIQNFSIQYIHISNAYNGDKNPGTDLVSLSYSF